MEGCVPGTCDKLHYYIHNQGFFQKLIEECLSDAGGKGESAEEWSIDMKYEEENLNERVAPPRVEERFQTQDVRYNDDIAHSSEINGRAIRVVRPFGFRIWIPVPPRMITIQLDFRKNLECVQISRSHYTKQRIAEMKPHTELVHEV